jgi:hypothetical protein
MRTDTWYWHRSIARLTKRGRLFIYHSWTTWVRTVGRSVVSHCVMSS